MAQGEFFKDYANACFETGRCKGITFWGLDDNHTWYDGLFTKTKPNLPLLIDEEGYQPTHASRPGDVKELRFGD